MIFRVYGQYELMSILDRKGPSTSHCISITNPGEEDSPEFLTPYIVENSFFGLLKLKFWDTENYPEKTEKVTKEDVQKIIDFYYENEDATGFTVHCWGGVARSTATALCLMYLFYKDEKKSIEELRKIRPEAKPLSIMLDLIDELTGSDFNSYKDYIEKHRVIVYRF